MRLLTSSLCLVWHSDLAHALRYLRVSHAANNKTQSSNSERTPLIGSTSRQNGAENGRSSPDEHQHTYHIPNNHPRSPSPFALHPDHASSSSSKTARAPPQHDGPRTDASSSTHRGRRASSPPPRDHNAYSDHDHSRPQEAPNVVQSLRNFILSGWINILLVAVPLSFISHFAHWGSTADFIISFIAIVPLASLLGDATEQCALKVGQTVGGLLNATFGNAVELIVGILALTRGELRIVQTSLLGSILSNLLLVLGCSFLVGGTRFKEQTFQMTAVQASSSLMVLGCATLVIPAAYRSSQLDGSLDQGKGGSLMGLAAELGSRKDISGLLKLSRGTAIILIICYACYLFFQLQTHHYLFQDPNEEEEEEAKMNVYTAIGALVVVTVITSFCADYLVGAIDEFAQTYSIPKAFIGLILLPIVGNAAEHVTSVWMAAKGKMELTIGVAIGSSIQIAVGLIPALVIVGWIINKDLTLFFENFETIVLFVSVLLVDILVSDGRSHWLEGAQLIALYLVIALAFWFTD
ncbi:calcium/proton exchanger [Rhodotorula sp. JG-1b]|nr:calcium/proton exchanger [Rhodotorula sp. JG-1b]